MSSSSGVPPFILALAGAMLIAVLVDAAPKVGIPLLVLVVIVMLAHAYQTGTLQGT